MEPSTPGLQSGRRWGRSGVAGNLPLTNIVALGFDPTDGTFFGVHRRAGAPDVLFHVDPITGASIPDAFGPGVGYVEIVSDQAMQQDFLAIAIAADGQMVGMGWDGTLQWKLHTIDKVTGAALDVLNSLWVVDLSYDAAGTLWGITSAGTLFDINGVEPFRFLDNIAPYTGLSCSSASANGAPSFSQDLLDRTDTEGDVISLSAGATDPDLDTLTYGATGLPLGLTVDTGSGLISGTIGSGAAAGSPYAVTITVTDNGTPNLNATDTFAWTITNTNQAPVLALIGDQSGPEQTMISFTAAGIDPDSDGLMFSLAGEPFGATIDPVSGVFAWTPGEADGFGIYTVTVIVTD